jgi:hypothetical protein
MSEPIDMDAPVTRREMHHALETWTAVIIDNLIQRMTAMIEASESRLIQAMERFATKFELQALEVRLIAEVARHTSASTEELTSRLRVVDDQYRALPPRVDKLEAKVFAAPKRKRR